MPSIHVVCRNGKHRNFLVKGLSDLNALAGVPVLPCGTPAQAADLLSTRTGGVDAIVYSLLGGGDPDRDLPLLLQAGNNAPVIVELDGDDPKDAYAMLRLRAYNVVSRDLLKIPELCAIVNRGIGGGLPYPQQYLLAQRQKLSWGFMSMSFDPGSQDHVDFEWAIRPTARLLDLGLDRFDDIVFQGHCDLRLRIQQAILERTWLVAQLSTHTPNTMYEIGFADAHKRTILALRRRNSPPLPAVLAGALYLDYSTKTELAMKLFFGLGGTENDL